MFTIEEIALHLQRGNKLLRAVVTADFAKRLLEENLPDSMINEFVSKAKEVKRVQGSAHGTLLVDETGHKIVSAQIAFGLETLNNIYEQWEYVDEGILTKIEALKQ